jgi:hypothetical protein
MPEAEVEAILDHYEAALWFLTHHPHEPLRNVKLINIKEMQILVDNSSLAVDVRRSAVQNVHSLIEVQAQMTPHRIAVSEEMPFILDVYSLPSFNPAKTSFSHIKPWIH